MQLRDDSAGDHTLPSVRNVHVIFCNALTRGGVSNTIRELLDNMPGPLLRSRLWFPQGDLALAREYHRPVFNHLFWRALCKVRVPLEWQGRIVVEVALRNIGPGDMIYIWPPYSTALIRRARDRGAIVVAERINCMATMCKVVLERAYARIGRPLPRGWCLPEDMDEERTQMALCDFVTAPGDFVAQSLVDAGIARERILKTSYGWSPTRLAGAVDLDRPDRPPVFAFVGLGIVRKGLNLLLEAWEQANVKGKLLIAGRIHDDIRGICARQLARPDIQELGYIPDIASVYAAADVFVFPTHEEGSPQVTYEAAGCGLAMIVSPMGSGPIVRNGREGYVIDPFDTNAWAEAIRVLAQDAVLRRRFGAAASAQAKEYTWQHAGARLYEQLVNATIAFHRSDLKASGA